MLSTAIDNVIGVFSPGWQARRTESRMHTTRLKASAGVHKSMEKLFGNGRAGGYEAGKADRLKGRVIGSPHENDIPRQQIAALQWRSWNLYRNNPQARKICRTLGAKVVGQGMHPQSQAKTADGKPFVDFRRRAAEIWDDFSSECDWRGKPSLGGQDLASLEKAALRSAILSGGALYRFHYLSRSTQKRLGLLVPLQVQLIHVDRLDQNKHGGNFFHGLELDADGLVIAFWVLKGGTTEAMTATVEGRSTRIPVGAGRHLFVTEDIDQYIGAPWCGAAMLTMDDRRNYEYSEMIAAEMAACMVVGYRRSSGKSRGIGLNPPGGAGGDGDCDLVDADGNPITHFAPGMVVDLGQNGELDLLNPARPNSNAPDFLNHMVRSESVAVPGVKSSTLTGDYRNSSFSSERSADNDIWPELEEIQSWFAGGFCQPLYEECMKAAVLAGLFDQVKGFSVVDFNARQRDFLRANWQGPVGRSINPRDDAEAARLRVKNGTSSPQREAAQIGRDWREIVDEQKEFIAYHAEQELPEDLWQQALGIEQTDAAPSSVDADGNPIDPAKPAEPARKSEQQQDEEAAAARVYGARFSALNNAAG
jgi:lambda family phage portal protein